jgi:1-deoxy-D-xylulose-5-phosphate synthase
MKPVVAIYSTFLQRGYDQLIHDIALQDLPVVFALDRSGLVGADGATHAGAYDIPYIRCIPNMLLMAPADEAECRDLLTTAFKQDHPAAVRYPRGAGVGAVVSKELKTLPLGKGEIRRNTQGLKKKKVAILAFGTLLYPALEVAEEFDATVANMRFIKPLDADLVCSLAKDHDLIVTLEEGAIGGGAGSACLEALAVAGVQVPSLLLGLPDRFVDHGDHASLMKECGLDAAGITRSIKAKLEQLD